MSENAYRFHDLFDQLGLPSTDQEIAAFLALHRPLPGDMLLMDAPFWDAAQAQFIREKKATDDPLWTPLIDQLSEALRDDPNTKASAAGFKLLGISGSLRTGSFNTALLYAAREALSPAVCLEIVTLHDIPLYDGDVEAREGVPSSVLTLRQRIAAADGLVIATPEYNGGIPGVLKNALDWVSRVSSHNPDVLKHKAVAVIGASTGSLGTVSAQHHWLPVLRALGMLHWSGSRLLISKAPEVFQGGTLKDEALKRQLADFMNGYTRFLNHQGLPR